MNPLNSLSMLRSVSQLAHETMQTMGGVASRISAAATAEVPGDFAAVLEQGSSSPPPSVSELRDRLLQRVESLLERMGIQANPAIELQVTEAGRVQVEVDHPQSAALESNLNDEAAVQEIADQLAKLASSADRRFVIHAVPQAR